MCVGYKVEENSPQPWEEEDLRDSKWTGDMKSEEKGDYRRKKEQLETDNNMDAARPVTETKQ